MSRRAGFWMVLLLLTGCVRSEVRVPPVPEPPQASDPVVLRLEEPQPLLVESGPVSVRLVAVDDSRCPKGARCVRAGEGRVTLAIEGEEFGAYRLELSTADEVPVYLNRLGCKLESLEPYPQAGSVVAPEAYRARVRFYGAALPQPDPAP